MNFQGIKKLMAHPYLIDVLKHLNVSSSFKVHIEPTILAFLQV